VMTISLKQKNLILNFSQRRGDQTPINLTINSLKKDILLIQIELILFCNLIITLKKLD